MIAAILPYIMLNLGVLGVAIKSLWAMPAVPLLVSHLSGFAGDYAG
jgi:hypothetical protein